MKHKQDAYATCPFYKGEARQMLFCEGVQKGSSIHVAFDSTENLKTYKNRFCKGCYNQCIVAGALNRKWGDDG